MRRLSSVTAVFSVLGIKIGKSVVSAHKMLDIDKSCNDHRNCADSGDTPVYGRLDIFFAYEIRDPLPYAPYRKVINPDEFLPFGIEEDRNGYGKFVAEIKKDL